MSARVDFVCVHCFTTPGDVRTSFFRFQLFSHGFSPFSAILAWFFTVFKVWRSDSDLFQCVLKRFKRVSIRFFLTFSSSLVRLFPSGIPVFRASGRILGPPIAQGPRMGSGKSNDEIGVG